MQIRGFSNDGNQPSQARRLQQEGQAKATANTSGNTASGEVRNPSLLDRSPQIARLAADLKRSPDVRADVVAKASQRLASGYYLTQEAAEATADRLMS